MSATCGVCGRSVRVRQDGRLALHNSHYGHRCANSDAEIAERGES